MSVSKDYRPLFFSHTHLSFLAMCNWTSSQVWMCTGHQNSLPSNATVKSSMALSLSVWVFFSRGSGQYGIERMIWGGACLRESAAWSQPWPSDGWGKWYSMEFSGAGAALSPFSHSCSSMYWPCVKSGKIIKMFHLDKCLINQRLLKWYFLVPATSLWCSHMKKKKQNIKCENSVWRRSNLSSQDTLKFP